MLAVEIVTVSVVLSGVVIMMLMNKSVEIILKKREESK